MNYPRTLLSLFDYTGNWSLPFEEAGWNVVRIDRKLPGDDYGFFNVEIEEINTDWMYENIFDNYGTIDAVIGAPPCTGTAGSGARHWKKKDTPVDTLFGTVVVTDIYVNLIRQCLRVVDLCSPVAFWAIEQPIGRAAKLVPELGEAKFFQPYWFGDAYSKKTALYGDFTMPEPTNIVKPVMGKHGSITQSFGGKSEATRAARSITPLGFAYAFFEANKNRQTIFEDE